MDVECYLIVSARGAVRVTKGAPDLKWDEIAVKVKLKLPRGMFTKPTIEAVVTVPDSAAKPPTIEADVIENVGEAIRLATGMHVELIVRSPDDEG